MSRYHGCGREDAERTPPPRFREAVSEGLSSTRVSVAQTEVVREDENLSDVGGGTHVQNIKQAQ